MYQALKRNLYLLLTIVGAGFIWASPANAGHLFTQASANTPINLAAGTGIQVTQLTYEGIGTSGNVSLNFSGDWGSGDAVRITIGSYTQTFTYDSPLTGTTQTTSALVVNDPTLTAAGITQAAGMQWTVIAASGTFTFTGYRIYVADGTFNGTGADTITQSQVVSEDDLTGGGGDSGGGGDPTPVVVPESFVPASTSFNTQLAQTLDALNGTATGEMGNVMTVLNAMTSESKQVALKLIAPEASQAMGQAAMNTTAGALDTVQLRLDSLRTGVALANRFEQQNHGHEAAAADAEGVSSGDEELKRNLWLRSFGGKGSQDAKDGYAGYDDRIVGTMLGYDDRFFGWNVGAALGYAKTDVMLNDYRDGDGADIETVQLTGYFGRNYKSWYVNGMVTYAHQEYSTHRDTGLWGVATGDFNGSLFGARVLAGMPLTVRDNITVSPFGGVEFNHIEQRGYTESGAGVLSLNVSESSVDRVGSILGTEVATHIDLKDKGALRPSTRLNWRHEFNDDGVNTVTSLVGGGSTFETVGQTINRNVYGLSLGLSWQFSEVVNLSFEATSEHASGYRSLGGQLMGSYQF